uniref:DRBM domain-containing protein n=1 Tax=Cacopsylla melanoneura TaxID=428564 RepID=A0A8D9BED4_9HEMI
MAKLDSTTKTMKQVSQGILCPLREFQSGNGVYTLFTCHGEKVQPPSQTEDSNQEKPSNENEKENQNEDNNCTQSENNSGNNNAEPKTNDQAGDNARKNKKETKNNTKDPKNIGISDPKNNTKDPKDIGIVDTKNNTKDNASKNEQGSKNNTKDPKNISIVDPKDNTKNNASKNNNEGSKMSIENQRDESSDGGHEVNAERPEKDIKARTDEKTDSKNGKDESEAEDETSDNGDDKVRDSFASIALGDPQSQERRRAQLNRRLNMEIEYLVERTARVIETVSKDPVPTKVLKKKRKKVVPESSKEPAADGNIPGNEPSTITSTDSAVMILRDHLKQCHLEAQYKHVNIKGSGHMVEHTFQCTLLDMSAEGKSRRKMEAKEEAALILLKQVVRAQKTKTLNPQIPPFSDNDLKSMSSLLNEKDNFENHLQNMCYQLHEPPPLYSVQVQGTENKYYSVQCDAMGYTAIGNSKKEKIARKIAAKSILDLVAIDQEKEKEREKHMKTPLELVLPRREYHNFRV